MEPKINLFTTNIFQKIWKKNFIPNKKTYNFKFISDVSFYKNRFSIYCNVGKNLTKGNNYNLSNENDYKNKTFIIYDVLPHLYQVVNELPKNAAIYKSIQYPGFLIHLDKFNNIDDYLLNTFSKNTRSKMRKFTSRLDTCFDITSKMFFGSIDKLEYDRLFQDFMVLLQKRFSDKQVSNNNMKSSEWRFYKDVAYPLILEKKASLFVVYDKEKPIAITYNYHTEDTLIDAITVFDIDYSKFNLGYVNNLKILNWCFDNNLKTLDFSKGYFDYKKRMCTLEYDFEYHIIYDKKSLISKLKALSYYKYFEFKAYLRNKDFNTKLHKFTYRINNKKESSFIDKIEIINLDHLNSNSDLTLIDITKNSTYNFMKSYVYDFLYLAVKPYDEIELYKVNNSKNTFIFSSDSLIQQIKFVN